MKTPAGAGIYQRKAIFDPLFW